MLSPGALVKGRSDVYRVEEKLAEGGMALVWLAESSLSEERVVIKEPKPLPVAVNRARFEADVMEKVRHPHVVRLLDRAEEAGTPLLIQEYIEGRSAADLVAEHGPMHPERVRRVLVQLLLALDAIHSQNIIHRDVKPRNLMLDRRGEAKLIDLGTAIYYNISGVAEIVYSQGGYTAPEQFMGYAFPQSDIWSAMATAFYMLTGRDPAAVIGFNYVNQPPPRPPDPRLLNPSVPRDLAEAIVRGMQWHVLDRFGSAREALDFLNGYRRSLQATVLEVMGITVEIDRPRLVFGRIDAVANEKRRVIVEKTSDIIYVRVYDPYRWISRVHFEILRLGRGWCIRDLGSTNRTAVMTKQGLFEIWRGLRVPGPCFPLSERALILVAYGSSLRNPPYLTALFRSPGPYA